MFIFIVINNNDVTKIVYESHSYSNFIRKISYFSKNYDLKFMGRRKLVVHNTLKTVYL